MLIKDERTKCEFIFLTMLFIAAVCIRFYIANFVKTIHSYPDELRYYGVARSLFMGKGLYLRNVPSSFQKVGYSLLMVPFFFIKNGIARIQTISFLNCVAMSLSVFPVFMIGKKLDLKPSNRILLSFVTFIWPDMTLTMTFMSEVLYWPITMLFFCLWLYNVRTPKIWRSVLLAFVCYAGYVCKDIFLAYFLATIAFTIISPLLLFFCERNGHEKLSSYYSKKLFASEGVFIIGFAILFCLCKLIFFRGLGGSYEKYDIMSLTAISNPYNFAYMVYAFYIYMSAIMLSVLFFPAVYPAVYYKRLSKDGQHLFLFSFLSALTIAVIVAYTVTVREDLGLFLPAIHLRYVAPVLIILIAVFLHLSQQNITDGSNFIVPPLILLVALVFMGGIFKGLGSTPVISWTSLAWYKIPQKLFGTVDKGLDFVFRPYVLAVNVCFFVAVYMLHYLKEKKGNSIFVKIFFSLCVLLEVLGNAVAVKLIKEGYSADRKIIEEICSLKNFFLQEGFSEKADFPHIVYVTSSAASVSAENAYFDTYFDAMHNTYMVGENDVLGDEKPLSVSEAELREPESEKVYDIPRIDYVIIPSTLSLECKDSILRTDLGGSHYAVYENKNPSTFFIVRKAFREYSFDWNICLSNGFDRDGCRTVNPKGNSYGPYWHVQKGRYVIEINGENLNAADIALCSAKGSVRYPFEAERTDNSVMLHFILEQDVDGFEAFIENKSDKLLKMNSFYLRQE